MENNFHLDYTISLLILIAFLCINSLAPMVKDFINMIWTGLLTPSLEHLKISTELETGFLVAEVRDIGISAARRRLLTTMEILELQKLHTLKAKSGKLYLSPKAYQDSDMTVGGGDSSIPTSGSALPMNGVSESHEPPVLPTTATVLPTTAPVDSSFTPLVQSLIPEESHVTSDSFNPILETEPEDHLTTPSFSMTTNEETIPYRPITTPISPFYEARDTSPATASLLASLFDGIMPTNNDYSFPDLFADLRAFTERTAGADLEPEPPSLSTGSGDIVQIAMENASETVDIVPEAASSNGLFISPSLDLPDSSTSISALEPPSMDLSVANDLNARPEIEGISDPVPLITSTSSTSNPPPLYPETPSVSRPGLTVDPFPGVSSETFDGVTSSTSENVSAEVMEEERRAQQPREGDTGWSSLLFGGGDPSTSSLSPSYKKKSKKKEVSRVRKSGLRGVTQKKTHKDRTKSKKACVGAGKVPRQFNKLLHKNVRGTWNLTREEFGKKQRVIKHLKKIVDLRGQKAVMNPVDYDSFINFVHLLEGPLSKISFVCPCDKSLDHFTPPSPLMNPRYAIYQPQSCKGEMALICITPKRNKGIRKTESNDYAIGYGIHKGGKAEASDRNISIFIYARDAEMERELSDRILAHHQYINTKIRFYPFLNRPLHKMAIDPVQSMTLVTALMILFYEGSFCVTSILAKLHHSSTEELYDLVMGKLEGCLRRTWKMPTDDE